MFKFIFSNVEKLTDFLEKIKLVSFTNDNSLKDLITEVENKLILWKQIIENPESVCLKEKLEKLKEASDIERNNWTYSTYNKYFDKDDDEDETPKMSKKFFNKFLCSNYRLYYRTHELNDILYLHYKGFKIIENLQTFSNLKVLYLEGNSIKKIEGLNHLKQLSCIYLQENCIEKIENLEGLDLLYNLNLSDNCIEKIENLSTLKSLSNLLLKRNRIGINDNADLEGLTELPKSVTVLDISDNRIEVTDYIKEKLTKISNLRVLYNQGNESIRKIPHYRKYLIDTLKELHYLDDKPVFENERRLSEAFGRGGLEEERKERALIKQEKEDKEIKRLKDFKDLAGEWKNEKKMENQEDGNIQLFEEREKEISEGLEAKRKRELAKKKLLSKVKGNQNEKNEKEGNDNNDNNINNQNIAPEIQIQSKGKMLTISEESIPDLDDEKVEVVKENQKENPPISLFEDYHQSQKKKIMEKPSNDIFNDIDEDEEMPNLETVKHKNQEEYINSIIEKNQNENINRIKDIELEESEEIVDTTLDIKKSEAIEHKIKRNEFDELD